jgi:hypothetical protein
VWVKLGGDKGHGSFKLNLQVVNVAHPNSIHNTCLLAVFKAGDTPSNLHTALDQYREHIEELQGMPWRFVDFKRTIMIALTTVPCLYIEIG